MCHFVTLIAPTDDVEAVRAIMSRHGRAAEPIDNPSVRGVLLGGERQYLTTRGHCDCGTILAGRYDGRADLEKTLSREAARMRQRGWSEAKTARAMEDRRRAGTRPKGGGSDSLELWNAVLKDLGSELPPLCGPVREVLLGRHCHGDIRSVAS